MRRAITLSLALTIAGTTACRVGRAETNMTDQAISDHVEDELVFDTAVLSSNIDVKTNDGIVTLTGSVDNLLAKERSARLATSVKGVRSVINRIDVRPSAHRTDGQIENDINVALVVDPATESYDVYVDVSDGVARLRGTVDSWQEKELVAKVVKGVRGVSGLENNVDVQYTSHRADSEIKSEIEQALRWNVYIDFANAIDVEVEDGDVRLSGTVGSAAELNDASALAWVNGVRSVDTEQLEVQDWGNDSHEREGSSPTVSDSDIEQAITDALRYDPRISSFNVDVGSVYGRVTLRGTVDNLKAKHAAAQTARNTYGVNHVYNRLKVRADEQPTDAELEEQIRDALIRDPYTESYEVTVSVTNGIVDLNGTVDTLFERTQAEDVASRIRGVTDIDNNLAIDSSFEPYVYDPFIDEYDPHDYDWYGYDPARFMTFQTDAEIEDEINDELWWSPFVDSDRVTVEVQNGTATLTGQVDSMYEKRAAAENAIEGGATSVNNNLTVQN